MADLNVFAKYSDGQPASDQLVLLTTADASNWFLPGMLIWPNPRRTSGDGGVNFYHGGPLPHPVEVQASCQNGTTTTPIRFDGTVDVNIDLVVVPFKRASVLPAKPTRLAVCGIQHSLAGLTYNTKQWGSFPAWFYGALDEEDRSGARSTHRRAGDTHLPLGISEAYIEPSTLFPRELSFGYDYAYDIEKLRALCLEAICDGFLIDMPLAGDGMSKSDDPQQGEYNDPQGNTYGYQWLMNNLVRILVGLQGDGTDANPDLTPWIIFRPGWDAVFYGWGIPGEVPDQQPDRVRKFGELFRSILPDGYLAIEHTPGNIPCGEGGVDYAPGGLMRHYDTIMGEYNTYHEDSFWQIAGRMINPYIRPSDQVGDPHPPYYLAPGSPRGEYVYVVFEPTRPGAYQWVRGQCTVQQIAEEDMYARGCGAQYTGYSNNGRW